VGEDVMVYTDRADLRKSELMKELFPDYADDIQNGRYDKLRLRTYIRQTDYGHDQGFASTFLVCEPF